MSEQKQIALLQGFTRGGSSGQPGAGVPFLLNIQNIFPPSTAAFPDQLSPPFVTTITLGSPYFFSLNVSIIVTSGAIDILVNNIVMGQITSALYTNPIVTFSTNQNQNFAFAYHDSSTVTAGGSFQLNAFTSSLGITDPFSSLLFFIQLILQNLNKCERKRLLKRLGCALECKKIS